MVKPGVFGAEGMLQVLQNQCSSQKLRTLVIEKCENMIAADIRAPNLRSVKYVNSPWPFYLVDLQDYIMGRCNIFSTFPGHM